MNYPNICFRDMYKVIVMWTWSMPAAFDLLLCFWINWWDYRKITHSWAWLFNLIAWASSGGEDKYLHTLFNLAQCNIKGSYIHAVLQYSRTVVIDLLQWSLIILPSERTWYDTVLHDTIYSSTLSGHRSQYSYLIDIHEQELLDSVHCPFHILLREVLHKV